jgi:hypothetical protein
MSTELAHPRPLPQAGGEPRAGWTPAEEDMLEAAE